MYFVKVTYRFLLSRKKYKEKESENQGNKPASTRGHQVLQRNTFGTFGAKIGNPHLKWAFSEAAVLFLRCNPKAKAYVEKLAKRHGKGKTLSILAHKIGRAVYFILKRKEPYNADLFLPV